MTKTARFSDNPAKGFFETVEIVRFGGGILANMVRIRRESGAKMWVQRHHLSDLRVSR